MQLENTYELSFWASETLLGFQRSAKTTNIATTLLFNCASFFTYFCYFVYNPLQKDPTGYYSHLNSTRSLVLMMFSLVFCTFTVLLFGCFSRKFVQSGNCASFFAYFCYYIYNRMQKDPTGLYSLLNNTRSLVVMIFILVFCAFTVLLFGCFSRKFVQVAISGFSTFTCATSTSTPPHKPTKVSIDSLWPTCTRYYRIWGPVCFNDELSTDDVRVTSKIAFWTFSLKYLQSTISTRDFITKPSSKYLFITKFDDLYNGVLQLCNL